MPRSETGSLKSPLGDPVGRALEPPDPPGEERRGEIAHEQGGDQGDQAGDHEHAGATRSDAAQRVVERCERSSTIGPPTDRVSRPPRTALPSRVTVPLELAAAENGTQGQPVVLDVGRGHGARVREDESFGGSGLRA